MEENGNLIINMREWAKSHNLGISYCLASSPTKSTKKSKRKSPINEEPSKTSFKKSHRKLIFKHEIDVEQMEIQTEDEKTTNIEHRAEACESSLHLSDREPLIRESNNVVKMEVEDDEADIFLKSVTSKSFVGDIVRESEQFVSRLLSNKPLKLEMDTIINDTSDSDNFLKEISSTTGKTVDNSQVIPNENKSGLPKPQSDVDKLIAEALEMVSK